MTLAQRLIALWAALQQRKTTFGEIASLANACGLDARCVLEDHFRRQPDFTLARLEA